MRTGKRELRERPRLYSADGHKQEDTPSDIADSLDAGTVMPADFLPPPSELVFRPGKKSTTIRIDADVLEWFQSMGKGYQTRINTVLRAYKSAHAK